MNIIDTSTKLDKLKKNNLEMANIIFDKTSYQY